MSALPIDAIKIGSRFRQDHGDIAALARSIEAVGLLHPIVTTPSHELVCGERRIEAARLLGWQDIPARIVDIAAIVLGEQAENEVRKDFTMSERVAIGRAVEVELGERRGRPSKENPQNFAEFSSRETRDIAAKKSGFGNAETYRQAKTIVEKGTPELVAAVDRGDVSISAAAELARLPEQEQRNIVVAGPKAVVEAARDIRTNGVDQFRSPMPKFTGDFEWYTPVEYIELAVEVINYIQKVFGYALTGDTREHALFFFHGTGANGKSVLVSTMAGILGDYHKTAPIETFVATAITSHPTDLAGLRGARLVTAVETEEGRRWAESKIKSLTGGDRISARFMRQDFFEFVPAFKLIIAGNHKPGLRSVDEAIRRRLHLVPFNVTIPPEDRDKDLTEKLKTERPGILNWAIEGCLKWQANGLGKPRAVADATAAYLEAEDAIAAWIDERCELGANRWEATAKLFASWKAWAELAGEFVGSQKQFREKLEARGMRPVRKNQNTVRAHQGQLLEAEPPPQRQWE